MCIDNDITINYNNLKKFVIEFIDSKYAIGWGKIKTKNVKKFIPQLIKIDKNLSHDFIRPLLWKAKIGISIPGQIFVLKKDKFIDKLPKIDTVYDDLTIGMIARKNNFEYFYSKLFLGSELPKGNFVDLIKQRIRWSKGMAQSIFNGIRYNMLKFVLIHSFMYHMLWIPYYIFLFIISKYSLITSLILFFFLYIPKPFYTILFPFHLTLRKKDNIIQKNVAFGTERKREENVKICTLTHT